MHSSNLYQRKGFEGKKGQGEGSWGSRMHIKRSLRICLMRPETRGRRDRQRWGIRIERSISFLATGRAVRRGEDGRWSKIVRIVITYEDIISQIYVPKKIEGGKGLYLKSILRESVQPAWFLSDSESWGWISETIPLTENVVNRHITCTISLEKVSHKGMYSTYDLFQRVLFEGAKLAYFVSESISRKGVEFVCFLSWLYVRPACPR